MNTTIIAPLPNLKFDEYKLESKDATKLRKLLKQADELAATKDDYTDWTTFFDKCSADFLNGDISPAEFAAIAYIDGQADRGSAIKSVRQTIQRGERIILEPARDFIRAKVDDELIQLKERCQVLENSEREAYSDLGQDVYEPSPTLERLRESYKRKVEELKSIDVIKILPATVRTHFPNL